MDVPALGELEHGSRPHTEVEKVDLAELGVPVAEEIAVGAPSGLAELAIIGDQEPADQGGVVGAAVRVGLVLWIGLVLSADQHDDLGRVGLEQPLDPADAVLRLLIVGVGREHALVGRQRLAQFASLAGDACVAEVEVAVGRVLQQLLEHAAQLLPGLLLRPGVAGRQRHCRRHDHEDE